MDKETREKIGLFRFSLIAPIINGNYSEPSIKDYLESICANKYIVPGFGKKEYAPATIKGWLLNYKKFGFDGLLPKIRSDFGKSRTLSRKQKEFIIDMKNENYKFSAKHIYNAMLVNGIAKAESLSLATVTRFISNNNLKAKQLDPVERRAFEMANPNDCWQSDVSVGPYLYIDGKKKKTYLVMFLDDCSRLVIHGEFYFEENLINLESVLKKAIAKRGIPKKIFVDNGSIYHSHQLNMICASLGTVLSYAKAYSPESKGKIERSFRTIKDRWMNIINWDKITSIEELNSMFNEFIEHEYNNHLHSAISMKPLDRFMSNVDNLKFIASKEKLDKIFLHRVTRKVKKDATISLNSIIFEVPQIFIGQKIHIRFEATSTEKAYIFDEHQNLLHTIFPVNKIDNSKIIRKQYIDFSNLENKEK